jgi:hypothetical protein
MNAKNKIADKITRLMLADVRQVRHGTSSNILEMIAIAQGAAVSSPPAKGGSAAGQPPQEEKLA